MTNPTLVPAGENGCMRVGVAATHRQKNGLNEFVVVNKNKVFFSTHGDCGLAYDEYAAELEEIKKKKRAESKRKEDKNIVTMTRLMKLVITAYFAKLTTREMQPLDIPSIMDMMKSPNRVFSDVIHAYFTAGAALDLHVNRPKDIFDICVREFIEDILDIISGKSNIPSSEKKMYNEASNAFDMD